MFSRLVRQNIGLGMRPIRELGETLGRLDVKVESDLDTSLFRVAVCASKGHVAHVIPSSKDERMGYLTSSRFAILSARTFALAI